MREKGKNRWQLRSVAFALIFALAFAIIGCNWGTAPEDEVKKVFAMRFYPSDIEIEGADEIVTVDIMVDNAEGLIAANVVVSFDPSVVEVTTVNTDAYGLLFTDDGADVQEIENTIDNSSGRVNVGIGGTRSGYRGASGSGSLAIITFKGKKNGQSALSFVTGGDMLVTAVYSSQSSNGWEAKSPATYNSTIVVHEKAVEQQEETSE